MDCVTDAHTLLWHLFLPRRLGPGARSALLAADSGASQIYVPAVVIAEMIMVIQRGRLPGVAIPQLLAELNALQAKTNYTLLPLLPETVINSHTLTAIPDIFDRLVVAEALRLGLPLITRDATIAGTGLVRMVWD
jgi:PIN domain nuclease of toxin-antitoxin system